jgi:hypothetical protein
MNSKQQRYQVIIGKNDVTKFVSDNITLTYNPDTISELSFAILSASDVFSNTISPGSRVTFYGGSDLEHEDNYGKLFEGIIKMIQPEYQSTGAVTLRITAYDLSYQLVTKRTYFVYPDHNRTSNKTWAYGENIKTSALVRGLIRDNGFEIGLDDEGNEDIKILVDKDINYLKPITQRNESEWQILRKVAASVNCQMWTTFAGDRYYVHFVDRSLLVNGKLSNFIFTNPERTLNGGFVNPDLPKNNIPIWDITIEQDYSMMFHVRKSMTVFDYSKGEEINIFSVKFEEGSKEVLKYFTFELDQDKLKTLDDAELKYVQDLAQNQGNYDYSQAQMQEISKYFVPATFYNEKHYKTVDTPYYGITLKFTCEGNVYIVPKKNYQVVGLGRYSTKNISGNYYLKKLTHTWGRKGFLSKLEMVR